MLKNVKSLGSAKPLNDKKKNMGYAVFHATKGSGKGGKLGAHIDRDKSQAQTFKSADPERLHLNRDLLKNEHSGMKLEDAINARIKEGYKGKKAIRKDAVRHLPMVMSGSHKEMKEIFADPKKAEHWINANLDFARKEFGENNIVRATLHLDEKTPHLHIVAVPLTSDGRLSAKEIFGDIRALSARQDRYAEQMKAFGLERGLKGSKAVHTSEGWYIAKQKEAEKAILNPLERLNFLERANPYKKIEVLSEGLKLAQKHKFDSDQKAGREEAKVSELAKTNKNIEAKLNRIIFNETSYKAEKDKKIEILQRDIAYEVGRKIDYSFGLHKIPGLKDHVGNMILAEAKKTPGITQEFFDTLMKQDGFYGKLLDRAEAKAQKEQNRDLGQDRNRGMRM